MYQRLEKQISGHLGKDQKALTAGLAHAGAIVNDLTSDGG